MMELIDIKVDNAVAIRISGRVSKDEMVMVLDAAKAKSEQHQEIVIFEEVTKLGGIALGAIIEELKYLRTQGISNISRVALVTDQAWMEKIASLEDKLFKSMTIKSFSHAHRDQAIAFLQASKE